MQYSDLMLMRLPPLVSAVSPASCLLILFKFPLSIVYNDCVRGSVRGRVEMDAGAWSFASCNKLRVSGVKFIFNLATAG